MSSSGKITFCSSDTADDFANKNEEFYNPTNKKVLTTICSMPHQLLKLVYKPETSILS